MTGEPVPGAGCQSTPSNLGPPDTANPAHRSSWASVSTFTQKLPDPAMRGQLVEVRAGATATKGGSIDSDTKLWQVNPTGCAVVDAGHDGHPGGEPAHGLLEPGGVERRDRVIRAGVGAHRFLSSKVAPSLAAFTSTLPAAWATWRAARSMTSIWRSVCPGSWWNMSRRRTPASVATWTA